MALLKVAYAVNCGLGSAITDLGTNWVRDDDIDTGTSTDANLANSITGRSTWVPSYFPNAVVTNKRSGTSFGYAIPLTNGNYVVELFFVEDQFSSSSSRVFDVTLEGNLVLDNYDIYADVGQNFLTSKKFDVTVTGSSLDITLVSSVSNASIVAILIYTEVTEIKLQCLASGGTLQSGWLTAAYNLNSYSGTYHTGTTVDVTDSSVPGGTASELFQNEWYGTSSYQVQADNGDYTVSLYFAEIFLSSVGQRVFDITIEGSLVQNDYDIIADVGSNFKGKVKTYNVTVADSILKIDFAAVTDSPKLAAFTIAEASSNVNVSPSGLRVELSSNTPTVIRGSIAVSPTLNRVELSTNTPTIGLSSLNISPSALRVELSTSAVNVVSGSLNLTPTLNRVELSTNTPTIGLSSQNVNAGNLAVELTTNNPTVVSGSLNLSPTLNRIELLTSIPTVLFGSTAVSPSSLILELSTNLPTVIQGSLVFSGLNNTLELSTNNPGVNLGSITINGLNNQVALSVNTPTVQGEGLQVSAGSINLELLTTNPIIGLSSITINGLNARVEVLVNNPTVSIANVSVNAGNNRIEVLTNLPTINYGSIIITPLTNRVELSTNIILAEAKHGQLTLEILENGTNRISILANGFNQLELI